MTDLSEISAKLEFICNRLDTIEEILEDLYDKTGRQKWGKGSRGIGENSLILWKCLNSVPIRPWTIEALVDRIWTERDRYPEHPRAGLSILVRNLRNNLGAESVITLRAPDPPGYQWNKDWAPETEDQKQTQNRLQQNI